MNTKKVSVIIPCYNATKYLPQCFLSLVNQTIGIENLELIFIDDASTDDGATWAMLQEMERAYPDSIIAIHSDVNMRQGGARNIGLNYVTGEYIGFVDSDDWVDETLFEKTYQIAQEENADIVQFGFHAHINGEGLIPSLGVSYPAALIRDPDVGARKQLLLSNKITYGCWSKIYRTQLVLDTNVRYAEHVIYEESSFVYPLLFYANCFVIIEDQLYFYRQNPVGTMYSTMKDTKTLSHNTYVQLELLHFMKSATCFDTYKNEICFHFVHSYLVETLYFSAIRNIPLTLDTFNEMKKTILSEVGKPTESSWYKKYPLKKKFVDLLEHNVSQEQLDNCIQSILAS